MKKSYILLLSFLVILGGCKKKDEKVKLPKDSKKKSHIKDSVNIPLASGEVKSYFDDKDDLNLGEFVLVEDSDVKKDKNPKAEKDEDATAQVDSKVATKEADDFSWVQEVEGDGKGFKKCYFEFDKYDVAEAQEKSVEDDIALAKKMVSEGESPTIVIEGHSCHSAGSMTYNLVLSEKRAKAISDRFVAAGVPADCIKIVPRGQECPAKDGSGKDVTGSRDEQWPNRRSEIRVVYS